MLHFIHSFLNHWRLRLLGFKGIKLGVGIRIDAGTKISAGISNKKKGSVLLGNHCFIERHSILDAYGGSIEIGDYAYLGPGCLIYGHGGVHIGSNSLIAGHVCIASSNHSIPPLNVPINTQPDVLRPTFIGKDVWIGFGAIILSGVTIGDGCVIGAGSVVTKNLPAGAVAMGVPAQIHQLRGNA